MERSWYWRIGAIVGVAILSLYQLVPSWFYFKLPPDQRNTEVYDQSVPRWAPAAKHHLTLGLDLQGGIHLAMGVDVDRAVKAKVARRADEIADFLKSKNVPFTESRTVDGGRRIEVKGEAPDKIRKVLLDAYDQEMFAPGGAPEGAVLVAFRDQVLRDFQGKAVEQAEKAIRNRVDKWGVTEPDIKRKANSQIQIQLPGFKDPEKAKELLGRTAQLEFKITDDESPVLDALRTTVAQCPGGRAGLQVPLPEGGCWTAESIELPKGSARSVTMLVANSDPLQQGRPVVTFKMTPQGAGLMEKLTTENMRRRMATVLDDKVETAPYIQGRISSNGQITLGSGTNRQRQFEEANDIALVLKAGALPAPVTISEERTVGATLGPELVKKGTVAALWGLLAVLAFMVLYYRASGLIADLALVLNGLLVLAIMSMIGSTLTLPGIAGFVLTLGMAVDANVLINERIREELRAGRTVRQAVQQGYDRVFWTIVDAHVTTLVAGVVLMQYGSGPVRGFAVTLIVGLVASMFTSIVVTRAIMEYFTRHDTARLSV